METTINHKRTEVSATFTDSGNTLNATIIVDNGRIHTLSGVVLNSEEKQIGFGQINPDGEYYINTMNGASPADIAILIEQAVEWSQGWIAEQTEESDNPDAEPQTEEA